MRLTSDSQIVYSTKEAALGAGQQTLFVQGSLDGTLSRNVIAGLQPIVQANLDPPDGSSREWSPTHLDLAGGGDGSSFMFAIRLADPSQPDVEVNGSEIMEFDVAASGLEIFPDLTETGGAQSEALAARSHAALITLRSSGLQADAPPVPSDWLVEALVFQTLLAGASSGGDFMNVLAAARVGFPPEQ